MDEAAVKAQVLSHIRQASGRRKADFDGGIDTGDERDARRCRRAFGRGIDRTGDQDRDVTAFVAYRPSSKRTLDILTMWSSSLRHVILPRWSK